MHAIARCGNVSDHLVDGQFHEHLRKQLKNKDVRIQKEAFGALERLCMDSGAADALVNTDADNVLKKTENADVEKGWLGCSVVVRFVVTLFYWCNYS